jgi:hypothetical protein
MRENERKANAGPFRQPSQGGCGGLVETCFSSLGRVVALPGKPPWLGCCLQGSVLIECYLKRDSAD